MKVLLIGASGQLGADILRRNTAHEIYAPSRLEVDLARLEESCAAIRAHRPRAIINCAAFHNVPQCELEPQNAFALNVLAPAALARLASELSAWLINFSSDYVFGGERRTPYLEPDLPSPLQVYGITRLAGEHAVLAANPERGIVIRTCGLYGATRSRSRGTNFVESRLQEGASQHSIEMACEQIVSPTSSWDLSRAVLDLLDHPRLTPGQYHLVNDGQCSWYEFTQAIIEIAGLPAAVLPVDRGGRSGAMRRPLYSALANQRAQRLGITLPPWRDALERYLHSR